MTLLIGLLTPSTACPQAPEPPPPAIKASRISSDARPKAQAGAQTVPEGSAAGRPGLRVWGVRLLVGDSERPDRQFFRGEPVEIRALVTGLTAKERRIRLISSWQLEDPRGAIVAHEPATDPGEQPVPAHSSTEVVETAVRLRLPLGATPGAYRATLRFRDGLSGAAATKEIFLQVAGPPPQGGAGLSIQHFKPPPDEDLKAGLPLIVGFELRDLTARATDPGKPGAAWFVKAQGTAVLQDASGRTRYTSPPLLVEERSPVRPALLPVRWRIVLPASLEPGLYSLRLAVEDLHSGRWARVTHDFRLLPGALGLYAVELNDRWRLPRDAFARGETLHLDLLLAGWRGPTDLSLDVGLIGPDNGFYLVRKGAHRVPPEDRTPPPRAVRLTLQLPELAPAGAWRLKLRLRANALGQEATREVPFNLTGPRLEPWPTLRVAELRVRRSASAAPVPLVYLRAGTAYHLDFVAGGMRLVKEEGYYHRVRLRCTLRLWDGLGRVKASQERACEIDRRFSFAPLRIRLAAQWTLPREAIGAHRLEVEVLDLQSNRVSSLQRSVFLLKPR